MQLDRLLRRLQRVHRGCPSILDAPGPQGAPAGGLRWEEDERLVSHGLARRVQWPVPAIV